MKNFEKRFEHYMESSESEDIKILSWELYVDATYVTIFGELIAVIFSSSDYDEYVDLYLLGNIEEDSFKNWVKDSIRID